MNRKENIEKDKKTVFAKDIVQKNPLFSQKEIEAFFHLFNLYADQRREANVSDIANTAKTLGFEQKHPLVYRAMSDMAHEYNNEYVRFQKFLTDLTFRLGTPENEDGRRVMFELADIDAKQKLSINDLLRISDALDFGLNFQDVQQIVRNIAGPNQRAISWDQFNEYVSKRIPEKAK